MNLDCSIPSLSIKVRWDTSHLCRCTVLLKDVHSFVLDMSTSYTARWGGTDGSGGKSIKIASISKCMDVLLVRIILNN